MKSLISSIGVAYLSNLCYVELRRQGHSLKVMRRRAQHRDEYHQFLYWSAVAERTNSRLQLCFADETGIDGRSSRRRRGWSPTGSPCEIIELLHRGKHISILALFDITGFTGFQWVEGGFNADDFLLAVKFMIIPRMYPQPNSVLVRDNCRIHHTHLDEIRVLLDEIGARYIFLAPYCACDDNPIELGFNALKCSWRRSALTTAHL